MKHSKAKLCIFCIAGTLLLVYGTAIVLRLLLGNYLLEGGLANSNYALLAFLIAVPLLFYLLISKNQVEHVTEVILTSGLFILIYYVYVNFMLVYSLTEQLWGMEIRLLISFPVVALILVVVLQFAQNRDVWWKEVK